MMMMCESCGARGQPRAGNPHNSSRQFIWVRPPTADRQLVAPRTCPHHAPTPGNREPTPTPNPNPNPHLHTHQIYQHQRLSAIQRPTTERCPLPASLSLYYLLLHVHVILLSQSHGKWPSDIRPRANFDLKERS
jgi:hypothetical protein